jgi:hypothetical protein
MSVNSSPTLGCKIQQKNIVKSPIYCDQSGFTAVEMMIAGTLTLLLSVALFKIILITQHMSQLMITQTTINSEARAVFDLLGEGGIKAGGSNNVSDDRIPGYHGRESDPDTASDLTLTDFRLQLVTGANSLLTREALSKSITCSGNDDRVLSCDATESETIEGYVDAFTTSTSRNVATNRTTEITFTIIDPNRVPGDDQDINYIQNEYSSSFWTVMTHIIDP